MVVILVRFSVLQRGMKFQGFDQIEQFFRRNTHQSMKIFLSEKQKLGVRTTLDENPIKRAYYFNTDNLQTT